MSGATVGKWIIFLGLLLVAIGFVIWLGYKMKIPFGKLPGDIQIKSDKFRIYFPIVTSIIVSVILTILLNLIRFIKK
jgi:hypothetical protein